MNTTKNTFIMVLSIVLAAPVMPVFADGGGVDCHRPENVKIKNAAKKRYDEMLAHDKAGRAQQAYDSANSIATDCISNNDKEVERLEATKVAVLKKSSLKLGEQAESKGKFAEAYEHYQYFHGIAADRAQMKLATAKPGDFKTASSGVYYLRNKQKYLSEAIASNVKTGDVDKAHLNAMNSFMSKDTADAMDPNRDARLKSITGYLGELKVIATKQGEKFLAEEDKIFKSRKTSVMAQRDTLTELNRARDWFSLFQQESRANDRAVKRGDTLLTEDSRKSLELAISYYSFPYDDSKEKWIQKVKDKASRLGDASLKKGEKQLAADYYNIAGLDEKASQLEESNDVEKEKAETGRQGKFKQEQDSLEKELGL